MVAWSVWALAIATAHLAAAEPTCSVSQIGQACAGGSTVCVQATCTTPQSSGAGTSVTCGVCTPVSGVYCLPDEVGKACSDGGVCTFGGGSSGGGGGDGIIQSYELQTCVDPVDASAGGSSSGVLGPSCPPEDDGKPCDGGGICTIYGGSSGGGLPPVSEAACTVPGSGSSRGSPSGSGSTSGSSSGTGSSSSGAGSGGRRRPGRQLGLERVELGTERQRLQRLERGRLQRLEHGRFDRRGFRWQCLELWRKRERLGGIRRLARRGRCRGGRGSGTAAG